MRILYLLNNFPDFYSQTFILSEMVQLAKLGHQVIVLADCPKGQNVSPEVSKYDFLNQIVYLNLPAFKNGREEFFYFLSKVSADFFKNPARTLLIIFQVLASHINFWQSLDNYIRAHLVDDKLLPVLKVDLINACFADDKTVFLAQFLAQKLNRPFILTFRARDLYVLNRRRQRSLTGYIKKSAGVITISKYNQQNIKKIFDVESVIIHSGIDVDKFKSAGKDRQRKIISVCRFVEKKGIEYLIKACWILKNQSESFTCVLIGDGPLEESYRALIKKYNLEGSIIIKDFLTQEEIARELETAMVFVLPNIIAGDGDRDILPNALKEAMVAEVSVITSDISGIEELIQDRVAGLLVPPKDPEAIAAAIKRLFSDQNLRNKLGVAGRKKIVEDFNAGQEAKKLSLILEKIKNGVDI